MRVKVEIIYEAGEWLFEIEYPDGEVEAFTLVDVDEAASSAYDLISEMQAVIEDAEDEGDEAREDG